MANLNAIKTAYNSILDGDRKYSALRFLLEDAMNVEIKHDLRTNQGKKMLLRLAAEYIESQSPAVTVTALEDTTEPAFSPLTCDVLNGQFCSIPSPARSSDEFSEILGIDLYPYFRIFKDESKMILYVASSEDRSECTPLFASNSRQSFIDYLISIKEAVKKCKDVEYSLDVLHDARLQRLKVYTIAIAQGFESIARKAFKCGDISPVKKQLRVLLELLTLGTDEQEKSYLRAGLTKVSDI